MDQIESLISENRDTVAHCSAQYQAETLPDYEGLALALAQDHDWTEQGARTLVDLADNFGSFMLKKRPGPDQKPRLFYL